MESDTSGSVDIEYDSAFASLTEGAVSSSDGGVMDDVDSVFESVTDSGDGEAEYKREEEGFWEDDDGHESTSDDGAQDVAVPARGTNPAYIIHPQIVVGSSALHGNGVFVVGDVIPGFTWLTWYKGRRKVVKRGPRHYAYGLEISSTADTQTIIDANHIKNVLSPVHAHLVNSSHPCLVAPYNEPNCIMKLMGRRRTPVLLTLAAIKEGTELLIDYHWMLDVASHSLCAGSGQCRCHGSQ